MGPDANSNTAAAIDATLNATYVFEFINICYGRSDNKDNDEFHLWVSLVVFVIYFIQYRTSPAPMVI
jgi:hypothetical protein